MGKARVKKFIYQILKQESKLLSSSLNHDAPTIHLVNQY